MTKTQCSSHQATLTGQLLGEGEAERAKMTLKAEDYIKDTSTGQVQGQGLKHRHPRPVCTGSSLCHPGLGMGPRHATVRSDWSVWPVFSHSVIYCPDSGPREQDVDGATQEWAAVPAHLLLLHSSTCSPWLNRQVPAMDFHSQVWHLTGTRAFYWHALLVPHFQWGCLKPTRNN